jgi:hypothetical protein
LAYCQSSKKFYTYDTNTDRLFQLDPATGALIDWPGIDLGLHLNGEGDITFDKNGIGYISATNGAYNRLFQFDPATSNSAQLIGTPPWYTLPNNEVMDGLAFDASSNLIGLAQGGQTLSTLNTTNATAISSKPTSGMPGSYQFGGLAFSSPVTMYAALSQSNGPSSLYTINTGTGAATTIGNIGYNEVCGLAVLPGASPPSALPAVIVVQPIAGVSVVAGGPAATYAVVLNSKPSAGNTVTVNINYGSQVAAAAPIPLAFDASNWNIPKAVYVSAPWQPGYVAPYTRTITHTASGDPAYNDISIANVNVSITGAEAGFGSGGGAPGGEGGFSRVGPSKHPVGAPVLQEPIQGPSGDFHVLNISHRNRNDGNGQPDSSGIGVVGWGLLAGMLLGMAMVGWKMEWISS